MKGKLLPILFSLGLIAAALTLVVILTPEPTPALENEEFLQPVTVTEVVPHRFTPVIQLLGTTHTRWPVEVKASGTARLSWLNLETEPGILVSKGDVLAKLDTTHLESQLAQALSGVRQAELNLEREQHEQTVALRMLANKSSSAYARREPQIGVLGIFPSKKT